MIKKFFPLTILVFGLIYMQQCESSTITLSGLDDVVTHNFQQFQGKKIGLICNHTSLNIDGYHIVDLFHEKCDVRAIFAPEHGFRGDAYAGAAIQDGKDIKTGIKIYSLYGKVKKPTKEMLKDIDLLVYDIQDVGVRFYTYISTMTYCMEAAMENKIGFFILDRPNPIRGDIIEGPILDKDYKSFVGMHAIPIRYGLTAGELARFINEENMMKTEKLEKLNIVKVKNWKRDQWYDETGMKWVPPSPNMPDLLTATVYPGMCLLEGTNLSEGRGTDTPFLLFGAPWLDSEKVCDHLNQLGLKGIKFILQNFTPQNIKGKANNPKYKGEVCRGIKLNVIDRNIYKPVETAIRILQTIQKEHPDRFEWKERWIDLLSGSGSLRDSFTQNRIDEYINSWITDNNKFYDLKEKYKIY